MSDHLPVPLGRRAGLDPDSAAARLLRAFLNGRKAETITAYRQDLEDFQAFIQAPSLEQAASLLLARGPGEANARALDYKAHLMDRELAANTINRRLTALRSLVKLGRTLGVVSWTIEVQRVKADPYRDTRGPGRAGFRDMLDSLAKRKDPKSMRDRALLRCLFDLGLRRAEVLTLDLEDLDREAGTVAVLGKGHTDKMKLTLPLETRNALEAWISVRGVGSRPANSATVSRLGQFARGAARTGLRRRWQRLFQPSRATHPRQPGNFGGDPPPKFIRRLLSRPRGSTCRYGKAV